MDKKKKDAIEIKLSYNAKINGAHYSKVKAST
jgi:hypothetical protein